MQVPSIPSAAPPITPANGRGQASAPTFDADTQGVGSVPVVIDEDVPSDAPIPVIEQVWFDDDGAFTNPDWGRVTTHLAVRGVDNLTVQSDTDFDSDDWDFTAPETTNEVVVDGWRYEYEVQFHNDDDAPSQVIVTDAERVD